MIKRAELPCSDAAVKVKTGRDWSEWSTLLDAKGASKLPHRDLAKLVGLHHHGGSWWSQTVAVGYERLHGKRSLYARSDGTFTANTSKTLSIGAADAHAFFSDGRKRGRWLREAIVVRTAQAPKSARISWPDSSKVEVQIVAKGDAKCTVAVEHSKLRRQKDVLKRKEFWKAVLERLAKVAEPPNKALNRTRATTARAR